jgi:UDP-N-acetylmuramate--alanine ligase
MIMHHPTEINAVHQAVRELYPEHKVPPFFQPHLFSRTSDFDDFAKSLSNFDEVLLMDIYPAREPYGRYFVRMVVVKMKTRIKNLL